MRCLRHEGRADFSAPPQGRREFFWVDPKKVSCLPETTRRRCTGDESWSRHKLKSRRGFEQFSPQVESSGPQACGDFFWVDPKKVSPFLAPQKSQKSRGRGGGKSKPACCFGQPNCKALASQGPRQWHTICRPETPDAFKKNRGFRNSEPAACRLKPLARLRRWSRFEKSGDRGVLSTPHE